MSRTSLLARKRVPFLKTGIALVLLAALWSGAWVFARNEAAQRIEAWFGLEVARGRDWTCAQRTFDGFPFALRMTCTTLTMKQGSRTTTTGMLDAGWSVFHPLSVDLTLANPVRIQDATGVGPILLDVGWTTLTARLNLNGRRLEGGDAIVSGLSGTLIPGTGETTGFSARQCDLRLKDMAESNELGVILTCNELTSPQLTKVFKNPPPLDLAADLTISAAQTLRRGLSPTTLDNWREQGGEIRINSLTLGRNAQVVSLAGNLHLDEERRPAGKIVATAQGIDVMAIAMAVMKGQGAVSLPPPEPAGRQKPKSLPPIRLGNGKVALGPISSLGVDLQPLY